jgi:hypothetical protein
MDLPLQALQVIGPATHVAHDSITFFFILHCNLNIPPVFHLILSVVVDAHGRWR